MGNKFLFTAAVAFAFAMGSSVAFGQESDGEVISPNAEKIAAVADGTIQEALASWWGFDSADATASLQAALNSGVEVLHIDKQSCPWNVTPLVVPSDIEIVIDAGVTVQAKEGAFQGINDFLFSVQYQKNVVFRGNGDDSVLLMRKSDYHQEPYKKSEWRHGICLRAVKNVRIENLVIRSTGGDGIYLGAGKGGAPCEDVTIKNVFCDDNNRQGISVISARNLLIEGCVLSNTRGTPPAAGIDFEPNSANECLINCVMRDCVMDNNAGDGIELWLGQLKGGVSEPLSLTFENCVCRNNDRSGFFEEFLHHNDKVLQGEITLKNCSFIGNHYPAIRLYSKSPDAHALNLENITIDMTGVDKKFAAIAMASTKVKNHPPVHRPVGGMVWDNLTIIVPDGRRPFAYSDDTKSGFGLFDITGTVTIKHSADEPGEVITIDDNWLAQNFPGVRVAENAAENAAE